MDIKKLFITNDKSENVKQEEQPKEVSSNDKPVRNVSEKRKKIYQIGMAISAIGVLMFIAVFFINLPVDDSIRFRRNSRIMEILAPLGIIMIIAGQIVRAVGERGLAGSGLTLDPEQAREDLEPLNRSAGGQIDDTLDEINIGKHLGGLTNQQTIIKLKCTHCDYLNDEQDKFCGNCGKKI